MLLPEALADSINNYDGSALKIYCEENIREKVASRFAQVFTEKYDVQLRETLDFYSDKEFAAYLVGEYDYRDTDGNYNPLERTTVTDYGVKVTFFDSFTIHVTGGEFLWGDVFELIPYTLNIIENEFGKIDYEYYISYRSVDTHSGVESQYEYSTLEQELETKTYDHVGKAINEFIRAERIDGWFWKAPTYEWYDSEEIVEEAVETVKALLAYSSYLDKGAVEQFIKSYFIAIRSEASDPEELDGAEIMLEFIDYSNAQGYTDVTAALMDILDRNRAEIEQMFTL